MSATCASGVLIYILEFRKPFLALCVSRLCPSSSNKAEVEGSGLQNFVVEYLLSEGSLDFRYSKLLKTTSFYC